MICTRALSWDSTTTSRIFRPRSRVRSRSITSFATTRGLGQVVRIRPPLIPMPLHRMSFWFNFRSVTSRRLLNSPRLKRRENYGEVAQHIRVNYNALSLIKYAEGHHLSPFPCMREDYYPRKNICVPRLQSGTRVANLQHGRASIYHAHKRPGFHEPSLEEPTGSAYCFFVHSGKLCTERSNRQ